MIITTPQVAAAIAGDHNYCHLIRMELANNTVLRFTEAGFDIDWNGETFDANGLLLGVDAPSFNTELRIGEIGLSFTAADQSIVALMLSNNQVNRPVYIYRAYINPFGQVIPDPVLLHAWLITSTDVQDDKDSATCTVRMASEWADFEAPRGRRTTQNSQTRYYPQDKGLEFSTQVKKDIKWGGA
ncbi:hypothetical protein [Arsukibacterium sp.]|uniref:baseplate hub domain-containing protein n=1 Tax=Arsukibacterium sp. TaxID=1977258 RepID=UPI00299CF319|nr:hypothetical protein [Arsukibacterium sp.]MDX1538821.1 hypothetical protein [Arsukibacterium sp.]